MSNRRKPAIERRAQSIANGCPHPEYHAEPSDKTGLSAHKCPACDLYRIWKTS